MKTEGKYGLYDSMQYWIQKLSAAMEEKLNKSLKKHGVTNSQWSVLVALNAGGLKTPAALAHYIGIDRAAITRNLDRLERKGFIVRKREWSDRRSVQIELTEKAKGLIPKLGQLIRVDSQRFLEGLSEDEKAKFKAMVNKMLRNAGMVYVIY